MNLNKYVQIATVKLDHLKQEFVQPGAAYRMIPLMRINDEIDASELKRQLHSLKEQGFGGIFLCCEVFNQSAPDKFTSEWWWNIVRMAARFCAEEDLEFWAYDDEDWPSGSVGGRLIEEHPEHLWKYLHPEDHTFEGPLTVELDIDLGGGLFAAAVAYQKEGDVIRSATLTDLTGQACDDRISWCVPEGTWTLTVYTARYGKGIFIDGYGDLMDKAAMHDFVDMVYRTHHDQVNKVTGARIKGFFTDEPALSYAMSSWPGRFTWYPSMPFTPALADTFTARHGLSWSANLPLAYHPSDTDTKKYLCAYWETCNHLYSVNYFKQIYDFCDEQGYLATGHLVVEENFMNHLSQQGGNLLTHFRYMHIPGIDWIHPIDGNRELPATVPKYATSIAHLMNRDRTWCESFAALGWGGTFKEIRRIVNWEHINGINMQIPICYKYSLRGPNRATFYCPGISYQQPYWDQIRGFADYEARMCVLSSGGGHVAQIALAYPETDIWSHSWEHDLLEKRSDEYNRLGELIRKKHYDFDILDDQAILQQAHVSKGRLVTTSESFEVLIMPRAEAVRRATVERCCDLVQSGGCVIFTGQLATDSFESGSHDPELALLLRQLLGDGISNCNSGKAFWNAYGQGKAGFAPEIADVMDMIREVTAPDVLVSPDQETIVAYHRRLDDGHIYLLLNHSEVACSVSVTLSAVGYPECWDAQTGQVKTVASYHADSSGTKLSLDFSAQELITVVLRPEPSEEAYSHKSKLYKSIPITGLFDFRIEETTNRPEIAWNFDQVKSGIWHSASPPVQVPDKIPVGDWCQFGLSTFSGLGHYTKKIIVEKLPEQASVLLDLGRAAISAEVFINGESAGLSYFEPYILDVTQWIRQGENELHVVVANTLSNMMSQYQELAGQALNMGGDLPERRVSGLIGPVSLQVLTLDDA